MKVCVLVLGFSIGSRLIAETPTPAPLDRRLNFIETIQWAIAHAPSLESVRTTQTIRDLELETAETVFLPQLDLSTSYGLRGSAPKTGGSPYVSNFGLQLSETLYDNGTSLTRRDAARLQKTIADLKYADERDKLILAIAASYFQYSLSKSLAEVQGQQFSIIDKQYRSVAAQYEQGVKTQRDYLRFKSELRRSEIEKQNSETNILKARLDLMELIGLAPTDAGSQFDFLPWQINLKTLDNIPRVPPDQRQHYRYRAAVLQRQVLEKDLDLVRQQTGPEISIAADANYQASDFAFTGASFDERDGTNITALLSIKYKLWDWGTRRRNLSIASAQNHVAEVTLDADLQSFERQAQKLMLDLEQGRKGLALAQELLTLETRNYQDLEADYRNGKVSYLEIVTALSNLLSAKVQLYSSYFAVQNLILTYRYHEGKLYASLLAK